MFPIDDVTNVIESSRKWKCRVLKISPEGIVSSPWQRVTPTVSESVPSAVCYLPSLPPDCGRGLTENVSRLPAVCLSPPDNPLINR